MSVSKTLLYSPKSGSAYRLSRSKLDLFFECPRCFYLDRRLGITRPSMPGFSLNSAVDALLKKEFDLLRAKGIPHEVLRANNLDLIPFSHPDLEQWRNNFKGIQFLHGPTNLLIFGSVDDIWTDTEGKLFIVDYKSTSTSEEINLDGQYKQGYKRQLEIYQWLFRQNDFLVSDTAYILYANASKDRPLFDNRLEFSLSLHPHVGDTSWIDPLIFSIKDTLDSDFPPNPTPTCEYCQFVYKSGTLGL